MMTRQSYFVLVLVLFFWCCVKTNSFFINYAAAVTPPGGQKLVNLSDPYVHEAVDFAVNVVNYLSGYSCCTYREQLAELDNGTSQVVSGWIYRLQTHIGTSFCTNNENNANATEADCPLQPGLPHRGCNFTIRFTPWMQPQFNLLNHTCEPKEPPMEASDFVLGRTKPVSISDPFVHSLADRAVNEMNKLDGYSCCTYKNVLTKIKRGNYTDYDYTSTYDLDIEKVQSFCTNNELNQNTTAKDCPVQPGLKAMPCHVTVQYLFIPQQFQLVHQHCSHRSLY